MPRMMSFSMTTPQFRDGSKDVTRRLGWWNLKPGDILWAVEKAMGLKKGEEVSRLGLIKIVSTWPEPLKAITPEDCIREGFPHFTPQDFVDMLCASNRKITPDTIINRIEFERLPS